MPAAANGKAARGIGPDGKPLSSYWKAKLDAEARQARIDNLEKALKEAREAHARAQTALEKVSSSSVKNRDAEERNEKLQATVRGLRASLDSAKLKNRELEKEAKNLNTRLTRAQTSLKEARLKSKGVSGQGPFTIRGLFEWLGVDLSTPRTLVEGVCGRDPFQVVLREDETLARVEVVGSDRRVYYTAHLSDPPRKIIELVKPCRQISSYHSDERVLDALKMMGATFHIDQFG